MIDIAKEAIIQCLTQANFLIQIKWCWTCINLELSYCDEVEKESAEFEQTKKYLIKNENLLHYDLTNYEASEWFVNRLDKFRREINFDSFAFYRNSYIEQSIEASDQFVQKYPSLYTKHFVETISKLGNMVVTQHGFKTQNLPIFVNLYVRSSSWTNSDGIKSIIPTMLALSIGGYSFVIPEMIRNDTESSGELFIRWIQLSTFMPVMQFSVPPWKISSNPVEIAQKFVKLHEEYAPTIIELAKRRVEDGSPMMRPMWYAEPNDVRAYTINDQFMLGQNLVVAPVLEKGQTSRNVYLPSGVWLDQHNKNYTGPSIFSVAAPLDELPYFKRQN